MPMGTTTRNGPVHVTDNQPVTLKLMMPASHGLALFANASWDKLAAARPGVADIVRRGCGDEADAAAKYQAVLEKRPDPLACF